MAESPMELDSVRVFEVAPLTSGGGSRALSCPRDKTECQPRAQTAMLLRSKKECTREEKFVLSRQVNVLAGLGSGATRAM